MAKENTNGTMDAVLNVARANGMQFNAENVNILSASTIFMFQHPVLGL
jgi:hypothetical protein